MLAEGFLKDDEGGSRGGGFGVAEGSLGGVGIAALDQLGQRTVAVLHRTALKAVQTCIRNFQENQNFFSTS